MLVLLLDLAPAAGPTPAEQEAVLLSGARELHGRAARAAPAGRGQQGRRRDRGVRRAADLGRDRAPGLDEFLGRVAELVEEARAEPDAPEAVVVLRPQEEGISVVREDNGVWRVEGRAAERAVAVSDFRDPDALVYVQQRLQKIGVDRALARAGARDGDVVRIGGTELEYEES